MTGPAGGIRAAVLQSGQGRGFWAWLPGSLDWRTRGGEKLAKGLLLPPGNFRNGGVGGTSPWKRGAISIPRWGGGWEARHPAQQG